jgi:hypothetical protein
MALSINDKTNSDLCILKTIPMKLPENACCNSMSEHLAHCTSKNNDCYINYIAVFDEYGIPIHDGGSSYIVIQYCPWCGSSLPDSKRESWFDELEKLGINKPFEHPSIPEEFKDSTWWRVKRSSSES